MTQLLIKLLLIAVITAAAFRLIAWLSDGWAMQALALLVWALCVVPAVYVVWRVEARHGKQI